MSLGGPECSPSKAQKNYLEDVLTLNEVTVKVAGCIELKEQLRNSTPFGRFVPLHQKCLSELWLKKKKKIHILLMRKELQLTLNNIGLDCVGPPYMWIFSVNTQLALCIPRFCTPKFNQPGIENSIVFVNLFSKYTGGPLYTQVLHPQIQLS